MSNLFQELKRRKVFRVAAVYSVVAWLLIQVADTTMPALQMPNWTVSFVTLLFIFGLPIAVILAWAYEATPAGIEPNHQAMVSSELRFTSTQWVNYLILLFVLIVAGFQVADRFLVDPGRFASASQDINSYSAEPLRASLLLGQALPQPISNLQHEFAFTPDGKAVAYSIREKGNSRIEVRNLADGAIRVLVGDGGDVDVPFTPSYSPSGTQLLYARIGTAALHVVPVRGGRSRLLTRDANLAMGASWLDDQTIVYTHHTDGLLYSLDVNTAVSSTLNIPVANGNRQSWPRISSDGLWLMYTVTEGGDFYEGRVDAFNLQTREVRTVIDRGYNASFIGSDLVIFVRDADLWAANCSPDDTDSCLNQTRIESSVVHHPVLGVASYAASTDGKLVFQSDAANNPSQLRGQDKWQFQWQTINGQAVVNSLPQTAYQISFSPDQSQLVFSLRNGDGQSDIAVYKISGGTIERRSFVGNASAGLWTPDGRQIVYSVKSNGPSELWITNADGSGQPQLLVSSVAPVNPDSISPDGELLVYTEGHPEARKLKVISLTGSESTSSFLLAENNILREGSISPDGRWIAYTSNELGAFQIFVRPFPNLDGGKWQASYKGGIDPQWTNDSSRLVYLSLADNMIHQLNVEAGETFSMQDSGTLAGPINWSIAALYSYSISPDGSEIIFPHQTIDSVQESNPLSEAVLVTGLPTLLLQ